MLTWDLSKEFSNALSLTHLTPLPMLELELEISSRYRLKKHYLKESDLLKDFSLLESMSLLKFQMEIFLLEQEMEQLLRFVTRT